MITLVIHYLLAQSLIRGNQVKEHWRIGWMFPMPCCSSDYYCIIKGTIVS